MINLNIKRTGVTNSRKFIKNDKFDLETLLKERNVIDRIVDLKNCDEKELIARLESCFSEIYTFVKAAREVEKGEDYMEEPK